MIRKTTDLDSDDEPVFKSSAKTAKRPRRLDDDPDDDQENISNQHDTRLISTPLKKSTNSRNFESLETPSSRFSEFTRTPTSCKTVTSQNSTLGSSADKKQSRVSKFKEKNESRYRWLLDIKDKEGRPLSDPDYDARSLYIPENAWNSFTPFEKQFWEIKAAHWDMVVFFKKGKFYELYEKDADIGHQQFDLKLTDRVNMRMVGVPESSFEYWASQFIAKGFKVAKVDQMENAIGKAIRDKESNKKVLGYNLGRKDHQAWAHISVDCWNLN